MEVRGAWEISRKRKRPVRAWQFIRGIQDVRRPQRLGQLGIVCPWEQGPALIGKFLDVKGGHDMGVEAGRKFLWSHASEVASI